MAMASVGRPVRWLLFAAGLVGVGTALARGQGGGALIPVKFSVPRDGYVTVAIADGGGRQVRVLGAELAVTQGDNTVLWDGFDDGGSMVAPGAYRLAGILRDKLSLTYEFSVYTGGAALPWFSPSVLQPTDTGWLSDHNPPLTVRAVGDRMFIGAPVSENGQDLMAVDLAGRKLWGVSHPFGCGPSDYAYDGTTVYAAGEGGWAGANVHVFSIHPETYAIERIWTHEGFLGVRGVAIRDGALLIASDVKQQILLLDLATKQVTGAIPLRRPGGLAIAPDGRLLAISDKRIVVVRDDGEHEVVANTHLTRPNRLAVAPDGMLFVTDGPTSWYRADDDIHNALYGTEDVRFLGDNQIKVFDPSGQFIRAIGTPGGRKPGRYDPNALRCPVGIDVDAQGRLWVAEWDMLPKRISVWTPDGKLVREFIGAHKYGGAGALDPGDRTTMIYDGMLFGLDWEHGTWRLEETIVDIMNAGSEDVHTYGGYEQWPDRIIRYHGRQYFVGRGTVWLRAGDGFRAVAHAGRFNPGGSADHEVNTDHFLYPRMVELLGEAPPGVDSDDVGGPPGKWNNFLSFLMIWTDRNNDGIVQPAEATFSRQPHHWLTDAYIGPDLSAFIRLPPHRGVTSVWRLPVKELTPAGAPVWDLAGMEQVLDPVADPGRSSPAAGDIRVLMAVTADGPLAVIYRYVVPGAGDPVVFASPTGRVAVARVEKLTGVKLAHRRTSDGYLLSASLPWQRLSETFPPPKPGATLRGDVGVLFSDPNGAATVERIYWSNRNTAIVADIPSEIRLHPDRWGRFCCGHGGDSD